MSVQSVLLPVFVYVLLVYGLLGALIVARQQAFGDRAEARVGKVSAQERARWISASYSNQFELPVLFFALVALALLTRRADGLFVVLEWLFVATRIVHAGIHTGVNVVPLRGLAFAAGAAILGIAWVLFAIAILTA